MVRNYKNINTWKAAKDFAVEVYQYTKRFPKEEIYGMTSQLRRAVVSIAANIAEGASRQHRKDYLNFLYIAKASHSEVECLLNISNDLKYLSPSEYKNLDNICQELGRRLYGLIKAVEAEL